MSLISGWTLLLLSVGYLFVLFGIALWGDKRAAQGKSVITGAVYALSIAVYCTTWTYYGSVGRAATNGYSFLAIYLGPTLLFLFSAVLIKIIRCSKAMKLNSIADFLSARYGKSPTIAALVTLIAVIGVVPYIALQLKAISFSLDILQVGNIRSTLEDVVHSPWMNQPPHWLTDITFWISVMLASFTILFGTRHVDASERHEGLVLAIAFESLIKLIAFLATGIFVTYWMFDGWQDLISQAQLMPENHWIDRIDESFFNASSSSPHSIHSYLNWTTLMVLSAFAAIFLPRQFHVIVVENVNENHLRKAIWLFPLYLWLINLFVLPIALGGVTVFQGSAINAESYILTLPLSAGMEGLALLGFLGGLSAATGMVIVEAIALSTMICNDLVLPTMLRASKDLRERHDLSSLLIRIRRLAIVAIFLLGYIYYRLAGEAYALVGIGLISFAAIAQFAPAMIGALYWRNGNRYGALAGLIGGFVVWLYTLLLPSFARSGWISGTFVEYGLWGIEWLRAEALFGMSGWDTITHTMFWSLFINTFLYIFVSLITHQNAQEYYLARQFVDIFRQPPSLSNRVWASTDRFDELYAILERLISPERLHQNIRPYALSRGLSWPLSPQILREQHLDSGWINFAEKQIAGVVGSASARVMMSTLFKEESLAIEDVMGLLDESSQIRAYSQALEQKSSDLEEASSRLRSANEQLQELDKMKDDFLATISHEFRTPLTSIRAFGELLQISPDISAEDRHRFLSIIVSETDRLTRLINQVLDLAKLESGRFKFNMNPTPMIDVVVEATKNTLGIAVSQKKHIRVCINDHEINPIDDDALPTVQPMVRGDTDRLLQVLGNLIANALTFNPEGGTITLRVVWQVWDECVRVQVEDEGGGVAEEEMTLIFDRFYQSSNKKNGKPRGTGLGLPISRQIVETHDGRLWVENRKNERGDTIGAVFIFELPICSDHHDEA